LHKSCSENKVQAEVLRNLCATHTSFVRRNAGGSGLGSRPKMNPKSGEGRDFGLDFDTVQHEQFEEGLLLDLTNVKEMTTDTKMRKLS